MISVAGIFSIFVSSDGWAVKIEGGGHSFSNRCAALEWTLDRLAEKAELSYDIWPGQKGWSTHVERGTVKLFTTREGALEAAVMDMTKEILKREKKARKKKSST